MGRTPSPDKALGQHFLFDPGILGKIADFARVKPGDEVLEIGPGPGGLTRTLIERGARVTALEADARMVAHLLEMDLPGLTIIHGDALKADYLVFAGDRGGRLKLVSNLPYNISGPLTARLLRQRTAFTDMTLMYQKEVADRIAAPPGGRERGILSALSQAFCIVEPGFRVPPGAFRPPPKVHSALVRFTIPEKPLFEVKDEELLWKIVHEAFQKRRKQLRNCLRHRVEDGTGIYEQAGLTGAERPEELSAENWVVLSNLLAERV